jgi:hypothetical protein
MSSKTGAASAAGASGSKELQWEPSPPKEVEDWLAGKTSVDFDAIEEGGRALYPDIIRRRDPKTGELQQVHIMLRVPNHIETMRARIKALDWCQRELKLPTRPTKEDAERIFGADYFDELDTLFILEKAIRDKDPVGGGHPQYMVAEDLVKLHPKTSIIDVFQRVSFYQKIEDPRLPELEEGQFMQVVAGIARARNCGPLVVIDGRAQTSFIVSMAVRLQSFLTR